MTGRSRGSGIGQHGAWIVIADGGRARIVTPAADGRGYETLRAIDAASAHLRTTELGSDKPGRTMERATGMHHSMQPRSDRHQAAKQEFVGVVAEIINHAAARGEFGSLVLVAPSRQLAALRHGLDAAASGKLAGSLSKDLTKVPDGELASHLAGLPQPAKPGA